MKIGMKEIAATPPGGGTQSGVGSFQPQGIDATLRQIAAIVQDLKGIVEYSFKMQRGDTQGFDDNQGLNAPRPDRGLKSVVISPKGGNVPDQLKAILDSANKALGNLQKEGYGSTPIGEVIHSLPFTVDQIKLMVETYLARFK